MPYPVFLAFVAKVVLDLMPTLGEDGADLKLIGVKPQIKKVFDMTGFSRFLTIE